ncbi:MAG TPA: hypothetical protein VK348_10360 [Planctomycetota bacterium]|nr:hypothetical protein [Planctomycetota bacterium]
MPPKADAAETTAPPPAAVSKSAPALYVIGASVSGGFVDGPLTGGESGNSTISLVRLLRAWLRDAGGKVSSQPEMLMIGMFEAPEETGARQVAAANKQHAAQVVAIDFLFWYLYGRRSGTGDERTERLEKFERGLEQLALLDADLLVGDVADMHGAAARMLSPSWIPDAAILQAANDRLRAWAKVLPRVHVFPLAEQVARMRKDGVKLGLQHGEVKAAPAQLLQGDHLHATRLGMAYLGFELQQFCDRELQAGQPLHGRGWKLEDFVTAAGADDEVAALPGAAVTVPGKDK